MTFDDAPYWHDRAEEARVLADQLHDPIARAMMLKIVAGYERLAQLAEERVKQSAH
jgi:hypothetical protein